MELNLEGSLTRGSNGPRIRGKANEIFLYVCDALSLRSGRRHPYRINTWVEFRGSSPMLLCTGDGVIKPPRDSNLDLAR
uniref:Uncharacterized protein n=1 Tax=Timema cristinae TaxID=61476 RepID=A0A7R9CFJ5_TIMCR|nr:unnamed protein product [Timema cristinae]